MTIEMIPLSKLVPSPANVRKTEALTGIDELAASIKAHGLLQNLQVQPGGGGKFEVVASMRRLAALKGLAKKKAIAKTAEIACHVIDGESAAEISLAENVMRLPMHPADQYEAFKALTDDGKTPKEIAARFGCGAAVVKERLKLAAVSPWLLELYRADEINLDQLMAFTVSDDHNAQEELWKALPAWNRVSAEGIEDSPAAKALVERHMLWRRKLPTAPEGLWDWLLAEDKALLLDLLAYCAGCSVNAVQKCHDRAESPRLRHADRLAAAVALDMTQWWQPDAARFFRHLPKARVLAVVAEAVSPEAAENFVKLKKDALTAEAEKRLAGTGWLPVILRVPVASPAESAPEAIAAE